MNEPVKLFKVDKSAKWELRHIPGAQLRSVWSEVRWFLEEVLTACPDADTWIPEDVYHEIKAERAQLFVNTGELFGCLVVQYTTDQYTGERCLHVWIAYSGTLGAVVHLLPEIERLAKNMGIKRITCASPFEAFEAVGFKKRLMMFERQI